MLWTFSFGREWRKQCLRILRTCSLLLVGLTPAGAQQESFTAKLWNPIEPIYQKTLAHPFLQKLTDGSLPRDRFEFYLLQDALYLRDFSRALSLLAAKAPREEWAITLSQHAVDAMRVERQLHESVLASFGISKHDMAQAKMAPTNRAYTSHLLVSVMLGSFGEGLAAVLPCYWIYWEVGKELLKRGSPVADYQRWIDQYASEEYGKAVQQVLQIMNEHAGSMTGEEKQRAAYLFELSARYEYMFWDMAWRKESWPPHEPPH